MASSLVQQKFGAAAADYAASAVHAKGESLARLVELVGPQRSWRALDVATGAGHTALALASHVAHVVASDITDEMLTRPPSSLRSAVLPMSRRCTPTPRRCPLRTRASIW